MAIDFLLDKFNSHYDKEAIIWQNQSFSYADLLTRYQTSINRLEQHKLEPGQVAILDADYSPDSIALLLAMIAKKLIIVPLSSSVRQQHAEFIDTSQGEVIIRISEQGSIQVKRNNKKATHELYDELRQHNQPGLVLFSSGSTGKSKAILHDFGKLLEKFKVPRHNYRIMTFLLYDHIGGINTLLYTLANGGCVITVDDRSPEYIAQTVDRHRVELLPTSPTFLNLLILSEAYKHHDLSSLKLITYGTEPMPETTLNQLNRILPDVNLLQTYGLSELGILRSKSKNSNSLWFKIGGEGFETKIVDKCLWIRAQSAMLGYLNAPSPFDKDGWMNTGDMVEQQGDYVRILGRDSEIINVGGEKVHPVEVESIILQLDNIRDVVVYPEPNSITGHIVAARVQVDRPEEIKTLKKRIRAHCRGKLPDYKIPIRVTLTDKEQHNSRFKKRRRL